MTCVAVQDMGSAHFTKAMQLLLKDSVVVRLVFVVVVLGFGTVGVGAGLWCIFNLMLCFYDKSEHDQPSSRPDVTIMVDWV